MAAIARNHDTHLVTANCIYSLEGDKVRAMGRIWTLAETWTLDQAPSSSVLN